MKNHNTVNYHIWNDEPIKANYYTEVQLPNGSKLNANIGEINIEKGDAVYIDYGRSMMEYTSSGKGYRPEFLYGKIQLHGVSASVVLENQKFTNFVQTSEEDFNIIVKKQKERIDNSIPQLKEVFISNYLENIEKQKIAKLQAEAHNKESVAKAISQIDDFFKRPKL